MFLSIIASVVESTSNPCINQLMSWSHGLDSRSRGLKYRLHLSCPSTALSERDQRKEAHIDKFSNVKCKALAHPARCSDDTPNYFVARRDFPRCERNESCGLVAGLDGQNMSQCLTTIPLSCPVVVPFLRS